LFTKFFRQIFDNVEKKVYQSIMIFFLLTS